MRIAPGPSRAFPTSNARRPHLLRHCQPPVSSAMSNDAWATTTCTPLIGNISNYDFEDSASPRNGALLAGMQKLVGRQLDGSGVEVAGAQEDMADYTAEIQNLVTPGFFFAGIIVVALLPLWVSRCCAHK